MSEYDLTVGQTYDKRRNGLCLAHLHALGLVEKSIIRGYKGKNALWTTTNRQVTSISLLNLATVCLFLDFVSQLLVLAGDKLMNDELFGHLPWWEDSMWVPVDFSQHRAFRDDPGGPFFFGSVPRLSAALAEIKNRSRLPLGGTPVSYDMMRKYPQTYSRNFEGLKDNDECVQWVWRGLYDAATIAAEEGLSIHGM